MSELFALSTVSPTTIQVNWLRICYVGSNMLMGPHHHCGWTFSTNWLCIWCVGLIPLAPHHHSNQLAMHLMRELFALSTVNLLCICCVGELFALIGCAFDAWGSNLLLVFPLLPLNSIGCVFAVWGSICYKSNLFALSTVNCLCICCVGSNLLHGYPAPPFKSIGYTFVVWVNFLHWWAAPTIR